MKTIQTTIYECEYCGKYYKSKYFAGLHESKCRKNPANFQRCIGCKFLDIKNVKIYFEQPILGPNLGVSFIDADKYEDLMYCEKKKHFVYPFWAANPIPQEDIEGEIPNEPMPKKCEHFKDSIL
ncbi:hypothetical protein [Mangrovibacterium sp.]|uniref:hypothetical protein n=1 Tax=Mangrovibacterium sp. TaxID=1961364 RepID=UPI00356A23AE